MLRIYWELYRLPIWISEMPWTWWTSETLSRHVKIFSRYFRMTWMIVRDDISMPPVGLYAIGNNFFLHLLYLSCCLLSFCSIFNKILKFFENVFALKMVSWNLPEKFENVFAKKSFKNAFAIKLWDNVFVTKKLQECL